MIRWPLSWCVVAWVASATAAAGGAAGLDVQPWQERPHAVAGRVWRYRVARFLHGPTRYAIQYTASPTGNPATVDVGEGPVGMPEPYSEGWYHGGFVQVLLNGQRLDTGPLSSFEAVETGTRAMADVVWHAPTADLRYRFVGLPDGDHLQLQIDLEPKVAVTALQVRLIAYPSYFTSWNKRVGARRVWTPATTVAEGDAKRLTPADGRAALLYDEVFDPAKGEGQGACALALVPDALDAVTIQPTGYPVFVNADVKPTARRVRLALWKFQGQPNREVMARFPQQAEAVLTALRTSDLTPEAQRHFDVATTEQELRTLAARPAVKAALGARLDQALAWVGACRGQGATAELGIAASERFLGGYRAVAEMLWEARLAALLDF